MSKSVLIATAMPVALQTLRVRAKAMTSTNRITDTIYQGVILPNGQKYVRVERPSGPDRLVHHVRHSPTGLNWGYGGSGPNDLGRSLLIDVLGEGSTLANSAYGEFTEEVIFYLDNGLRRDCRGTWRSPMVPTVCWTITASSIMLWIDGYVETMRQYAESHGNPGGDPDGSEREDCSHE